MSLPRIKASILSANSDALSKIIQREHILGIVGFSNDTRNCKHPLENINIPYIHIEMPPFLHDKYYEVWTSSHDISYGKSNDLQYATNGYHFFSAISVKETNGNLDQIGTDTYNHIFENIKKHNYPYISRMWCYIPYLNEFVHETERYKLFSYGRTISFNNNDVVYPASTGIGCYGDSVNICLISTTKNGNINIENPKQTPAYKYPATYGIKSPSFARATYFEYDQDIRGLYVSGTASILGHETVFKGDVEKQCKTTIGNIETLISQENLSNYGIKRNYGLKDLDCIKVYIRNIEDFLIVHDICRTSFPAEKSIVYLHADICRKDLLVEIEGLIQ